MILVLALCFLLSPWQPRAALGAAVLDPALFLSPSPPLTLTASDVTAEERWAGLEPRVERNAVDLSVVPLEKEPETTEPAESMEKAETFWPSLRVGNYGIRSLHVPLTFAVSGNYGNYGSSGTGVIASSYGNAEVLSGVSGGFGALYGKSALAGSSYSSYSLPKYGTRIYGSGGTALWSGWGNGKWGHYGKG